MFKTREPASEHPAPPSLTVLDWSRPAPDVLAVRVVARLRVAAAIGIAATGSFLPHLTAHTADLFLFLGLVWLPWSCALLFAADQPGNRLAQFGGPIGDLVTLFMLQLLIPDARNGVLLGYLIVIAFTVYTVGRPVAGLLATTALGFTMVDQTTLAVGQRLQTSILVPFGVTVIALVFLLDRTVTLQLRAAATSQRLQSQSAAILARVADGVVVTDALSHILQWNPAAQRIIGHPGPEAIGLSCAEVLSLRCGGNVLDCSQGCQLLLHPDGTDGQDDSLGREVWRVHQRGRRQPLLANASAVLDGDGHIVEIVHSFRDITRLKQAEEAKTLFLATASHELKTPLTVINGFSETLLQIPDLGSDQSRLALEAIHRRGLELAKIVDRLLLSSRIEAGQAEVPLTEVAVARLIEERVVSLRDATQRPITLDAESELSKVSGNEQALITVIDHLLDNAIKYSPGGQPVAVTVTAGAARSAGSAGKAIVRIEVADQGIGMDAEQAAHCFHKFWQAESTDVRRFGGTGIGLYIVRSLVEAMGGAVSVRSAEGAGSTFVVDLVVARPSEQPWADADQGESSSIREFMRQIGVPGGAGAGQVGCKP